MLKKISIFTGLCMLSMSVYAEKLTLIKDPTPHFNLQLENQTDKDVTTSFQVVYGNVSLAPAMADHTPLPAHQDSVPYGVVYPDLGSTDTFNVIFTGQNDCAVKVEFFAPGDPKLTWSGLGCHGGGYKITGGGHTLLIYITDIRKS